VWNIILKQKINVEYHTETVYQCGISYWNRKPMWNIMMKWNQCGISHWNRKLMWNITLKAEFIPVYIMLQQLRRILVVKLCKYLNPVAHK
jgi:hypothetical protein